MENKSDKRQLFFSILMANYNNGEFLNDSIHSVIDQSVSTWELIIVDDCSKDNSVEIITPYLSDSRIKLIKHDKNMGYAGALKTAALNAKYDILGILDSDDKLHSSAVEIMIKAYQDSPNYGFIYSKMLICDRDLKNCRVAIRCGPVIPEKFAIRRSNISHFKTFLKEAYEKTSGFDPKQKRSVDKDIIYKLEEVIRFKYIDIPLYYYREYQTGISQGKNYKSAVFYGFRAKYKAYLRRLNTPIPNFTKREIRFEYYRIYFYKQIIFLRLLSKKLRLYRITLKLSSFLPNSSFKTRFIIMLYKKRQFIGS